MSSLYSGDLIQRDGAHTVVVLSNNGENPYITAHSKNKKGRIRDVFPDWRAFNYYISVHGYAYR